MQEVKFHFLEGKKIRQNQERIQLHTIYQDEQNATDIIAEKFCKEIEASEIITGCYKVILF